MYPNYRPTPTSSDRALGLCQHTSPSLGAPQLSAAPRQVRLQPHPTPPAVSTAPPPLWGGACEGETGWGRGPCACSVLRSAPGGGRAAPPRERLGFESPAGWSRKRPGARQAMASPGPGSRCPLLEQRARWERKRACTARELLETERRYLEQLELVATVRASRRGRQPEGWRASEIYDLECGGS